MMGRDLLREPTFVAFARADLLDVPDEPHAKPIGRKAVMQRQRLLCRLQLDPAGHEVEREGEEQDFAAAMEFVQGLGHRE